MWILTPWRANSCCLIACRTAHAAIKVHVPIFSGGARSTHVTCILHGETTQAASPLGRPVAVPLIAAFVRRVIEAAIIIYLRLRHLDTTITLRIAFPGLMASCGRMTLSEPDRPFVHPFVRSVPGLAMCVRMYACDQRRNGPRTLRLDARLITTCLSLKTPPTPDPRHLTAVSRGQPKPARFRRAQLSRRKWVKRV